MGDFVWIVSDTVTRELLSFAAFGILLLGTDDLLLDMAWLATAVRRKRVVQMVRSTKEVPFSLTVLVPAWDESAVIEAMLRHTLSVWAAEDVSILVGVYPNDLPTHHAVTTITEQDRRVGMVVLPHAGPTTKADCLNHLWRAALKKSPDAVVLHDAEDVVAPGELALFRRLLSNHDMVQLPVLPLVSGRLIGDSYYDEFAEAHGKEMPTRQALGASVPGAGVGCAIRADALASRDVGEGPFPAASLVEDYEFALELHAAGGRTLFVPVEATDGTVVIRAQFPVRVDMAVRQKSRWVAGIALKGWDRIGWSGGPAEVWMRLRDRRAPFAALVLTAGYVGFAFAMTLAILAWAGASKSPTWLSDPWLMQVSAVTVCLLIWRLAIRVAFSVRAGGWRNGVGAAPRALISNFIAIASARRAIGLYLSWRRTGAVTWDKTSHEFQQPMPIRC